jgi:acyl-CoA synthetase (AMP-forming)/AMP-acid ligase II
MATRNGLMATTGRNSVTDTLPPRAEPRPISEGTAVATGSLAGLLRVPVAAHPDSLAVTGDGRTVTYAQLGERSDRVASGLLALGLQAGDRVAYLGRNATEYWELFFGAQKAGLVVVPMNFRLERDEVTWILGDADVAAVLIEQACVAQLPVDLDVPVLVFGDPGEELDLSRGRRDFESWMAGQEPVDPHREVHGDNLAALMYSSGTTGRPKGVRISVHGLLWVVDVFGAQFDMVPTSVVLVPTPYYHIAAGGCSLITLFAGGTIVQFREPTPPAILNRLVEQRATHAVMVPALINFLVASPEAATADFSSLRHIIYGASPISESLMVRAHRLFGAALSQSYGLTETIGVATFLRPEDHVPDPATVHRLRSAGRPLPGMEVAVVDPATGAPLPTGEAGEVVTRGPSVTSGYWGNESATREAFLEENWLRTGDVGSLDDDGYLYLRDRIKDLIVSGGENVYPAEVENVLAAHPAVAEVAVVGAPSERWGETPVAFVVPVAGQQVDEGELIAFCRERLAHYKCPTRVELSTALPRNPSGKVLKRELRQPLWANLERTIG